MYRMSWLSHHCQVGGFSVNPYVGCPHACKYCYASFMKRFTGHTESWGTFLYVKHWKPIDNPHKYDGQRIVIGSVTDGYHPYEEEFCRTRNTHRVFYFTDFPRDYRCESYR